MKRIVRGFKELEARANAVPGGYRNPYTTKQIYMARVIAIPALILSALLGIALAIAFVAFFFAYWIYTIPAAVVVIAFTLLVTVVRLGRKVDKPD